ncbi:MAG: ABC transporter substrate-binding protein, partial [Actinomycetales bacterium]
YPLTRLDPVRGDHVDPPSVAIFQTLLRKGPDGRPLPGLAQAWQVDQTGLTWRLHLRPDAQFHSGARCDADAVVQALAACRWGEGLPRQVWYWDPVDQVIAVDESTIDIRVHYPCSRLPVLLWGTHTAIANPEPWRRFGDEFGMRSADGTGPYRLISFSPEQVSTERVHPGSGPEVITWTSVPDDDRRAACLDDPEFDIVRYLDAGRCLASDGLPGGWRGFVQQENSQFLLALNFDDPRGFASLDLRRCFDAFIDRERLLATALAGHGDARRSPIPVADPCAAHYQPELVPAWSPDRANRTLADLGWQRDSDGILTRGHERMSIDCVVQDTTVGRAVALEVARQLREHGIDLRLRPEPLFEAFYRAVEAGPAAFISKWLWPDAMEAIMGFSRTDCIEPGGGNWQHARCPSVDAAYDAFLAAGTPEEQAATSSEAQRAFMTDLPYLPLVSPMESVAVRHRVSGFSLTQGTLYPTYEGLTLGMGAR